MELLSGLFGPGCGDGYLLAHAAAEFDLKIERRSRARGQIDRFALMSGTRSRCATMSYLPGGTSVNSYLPSSSVSTRAFQLKDRDQNVVNRFAGLAECYGAAQRRCCLGQCGQTDR